MSVSDFRVAVGFQNHPKVKQLRRRLGDAAAFSLVCLWGFAAEQGGDGTLPNDPDFIATASDWTGDPERFVNALIDYKLLDRRGESLQVHDWTSRNPFAASFEKRSAQSREANKIRWEREHRNRVQPASEPESGSDANPIRSGPGSAPPFPSSSLPIPNRVRSKRSDDIEAGVFERFYAEYPRHEARKKALEAWNRLEPDPETQTQILADVKHRAQTVWLGKDRQFIPLPASYLNGRRWEDEIGGLSRNGTALPPTSEEYYRGGQP